MDSFDQKWPIIMEFQEFHDLDVKLAIFWRSPRDPKNSPAYAMNTANVIFISNYYVLGGTQVL